MLNSILLEVHGKEIRERERAEDYNVRANLRTSALIHKVVQIKVIVIRCAMPLDKAFNHTAPSPSLPPQSQFGQVSTLLDQLTNYSFATEA